MQNAQLLVCACGDCDDWLIGRDAQGQFIKCMTCETRFAAKYELTGDARLKYVAAAPALERGRKLVPKAKHRATRAKSKRVKRRKE